LGVGYHQDFYLIINNYSNIIEFSDITTNKSIGVLEDSYYLFIKLLAAYNIDIFQVNKNIYRDVNIEDLLDNFAMDKYDCIFLVVHPKNQQLIKMTENIKCRYIHIQKRSDINSRTNINGLIKNDERQGSGTNAILPVPPDVNKQAIYADSLLKDLKTENIRETFNDIMKKYFQHIYPRAVDLNKFHKSGNIYSYLDTYSTRMILVIRDDMPEDRIKYITGNYINELQRIRDIIDREQFNPKLNNFSSLEFNYDELISFDPVIPLAKGAKNKYETEGLITYGDDLRCVL